jgi:VIT1/CCC1 family predicted Fe2+/Mn2+ transporter
LCTCSSDLPVETSDATKRHSNRFESLEMIFGDEMSVESEMSFVKKQLDLSKRNDSNQAKQEEEEEDATK